MFRLVINRQTRTCTGLARASCLNPRCVIDASIILQTRLTYFRYVFCVLQWPFQTAGKVTQTIKQTKRLFLFYFSCMLMTRWRKQHRNNQVTSPFPKWRVRVGDVKVKEDQRHGMTRHSVLHHWTKVFWKTFLKKNLKPVGLHRNDDVDVDSISHCWIFSSKQKKKSQ